MSALSACVQPGAPVARGGHGNARQLRDLLDLAEQIRGYETVKLEKLSRYVGRVEAQAAAAGLDRHLSERIRSAVQPFG